MPSVERGIEPTVGVLGAMVFGTLLLPFSSNLYGHVLAAAFAFGAVGGARRDRPPGRAGRLAGLLVGVAVTAEYQVAIVALVLVGFLALRGGGPAGPLRRSAPCRRPPCSWSTSWRRTGSPSTRATRARDRRGVRPLRHPPAAAQPRAQLVEILRRVPGPPALHAGGGPGPGGAGAALARQRDDGAAVGLVVFAGFLLLQASGSTRGPARCPGPATWSPPSRSSPSGWPTSGAACRPSSAAVLGGHLGDQHGPGHPRRPPDARGARLIDLPPPRAARRRAGAHRVHHGPRPRRVARAGGAGRRGPGRPAPSGRRPRVRRTDHGCGRGRDRSRRRLGPALRSRESPPDPAPWGRGRTSPRRHHPRRPRQLPVQGRRRAGHLRRQGQVAAPAPVELLPEPAEHAAPHGPDGGHGRDRRVDPGPQRRRGASCWSTR